IAIFIPPLPGRRVAPVLSAIRTAARRAARHGVPVAAVIMAPGEPDAAPPAPGQARVPVYATPEQAARALGHVVRHAARVHAPPPLAQAPPGIAADDAAAVVSEALAAGRGWLEPGEVARVLGAYGIAPAPFEAAPTPAAAGRCAARLGGAVALKAIVPGLLHKSDAGAVRLGLQGAAAVERAACAMRAALVFAGREVEGFVVQQMAAPGVEMLVGLASDEHFGPVVACAAGGTAVELLGDVQVRLAPVAAAEAAEMVRALRTFPLLDGYRGAPRTDVPALEDVVVRVGALAAAHPEIAELDLDPVVVSPSGALVVDARIRVQRPPRRAPVIAAL
ncbi:MAG: hypothetical protein QOD69_2324, partial [Solirubrobacteraceae bacterium]|nr:hypothetical protein [Solirubrobacteraceae bacterium]